MYSSGAITLSIQTDISKIPTYDTLKCTIDKLQSTLPQTKYKYFLLNILDGEMYELSVCRDKLRQIKFRNIIKETDEDFCAKQC
jgi:hypothetical protein